MKDWASFLSNLIEKFDIKKLIICVFIVLALMVVPKINFLNFLMPLDNAEKWIKFIFATITTYIVLSILIFLWKHTIDYFKYKPKKLFRMVWNYNSCISIFYSEEINEYSANAIELYRYGVSKDVINKLSENNIIERAGYTHNKYRLTKKARKKLTRMRKIVMFIDSRIINRKNVK